MGLLLENNYSIIVGCGRLGANLADALYDRGANVLIMDTKEDSFRKLSPSFGGITFSGDATDLAMLKECEIQDATAVVAVTESDNTNILVAQLVKELFHVPNVIARLYDPEKECVYRDGGIETICPAVLSAKAVERMLKFNLEEENKRVL